MPGGFAPIPSRRSTYQQPVRQPSMRSNSRMGGARPRPSLNGPQPGPRLGGPHAPRPGLGNQSRVNNSGMHRTSNLRPPVGGRLAHPHLPNGGGHPSRPAPQRRPTLVSHLSNAKAKLPSVGKKIATHATELAAAHALLHIGTSMATRGRDHMRDRHNPELPPQSNVPLRSEYHSRQHVHFDNAYSQQATYNEDDYFQPSADYPDAESSYPQDFGQYQQSAELYQRDYDRYQQDFDPRMQYAEENLDVSYGSYDGHDVYDGHDGYDGYAEQPPEYATDSQYAASDTDETAFVHQQQYGDDDTASDLAGDFDELTLQNTQANRHIADDYEAPPSQYYADSRYDTSHATSHGMAYDNTGEGYSSQTSARKPSQDGFEDIYNQINDHLDEMQNR